MTDEDIVTDESTVSPSDNFPVPGKVTTALRNCICSPVPGKVTTASRNCSCTCVQGSAPAASSAYGVARGGTLV